MEEKCDQPALNTGRKSDNMWRPEDLRATKYRTPIPIIVNSRLSHGHPTSEPNQ